jgi:predicted ATPase
MISIKNIKIKGYKSIRDQFLDFSKVNILIGANGAGKSNFVSFFRMLNYMLTEGLQIYIGESGGANSLLYYGSKTTPQMECTAEFKVDQTLNSYHFRLTDAAPDTLIFTEENLSFHKEGFSNPKYVYFEPGRKETQLQEYADRGDKTAHMMRVILGNCRVFQFHDTSPSAFMRKSVLTNDNRYLRSNAGNLAAFLYMLKIKYNNNYKKIEQVIKMVAPHFGRFTLEPTELNSDYIKLEWQERESDYPFGPHQLSDGLLRFIGLTTLILQPEEFLPSIIIIDEPELGLHPYALTLLASMIKEVSDKSQVILATQSATLLDHFDTDDVVVVERYKQESIFKRLDKKELETWKEEYTLGEMWQKNLFGGRPK